MVFSLFWAPFPGPEEYFVSVSDMFIIEFRIANIGPDVLTDNQAEPRISGYCIWTHIWYFGKPDAFVQTPSSYRWTLGAVGLVGWIYIVKWPFSSRAEQWDSMFNDSSDEINPTVSEYNQR